MEGRWENGGGNALITSLCQVINLTLQRPLEVRKALRATPEPQFRADIVPSLRAECASSARNPDLEGYEVPDL